MSANNKLVVKVVLAEDIRRITSDVRTMVALRQQIVTMFGAQLQDCPQFAIRYRDEDGDLITCTTDMELQEAVEVARQRSPALLKLFVDRGLPADTCLDASSVRSAVASAAAATVPSTTSAPSSAALARSNAAAAVAMAVDAPAPASPASSAAAAAASAGTSAPNSSTTAASPLAATASALSSATGLRAQFNPSDSTLQLSGTADQLAGLIGVLDQVRAMARSAGAQAELTITQDSRIADAAAAGRDLAEVADGQAVHYGVTCDGCAMRPIIGVRFKCACCPDYDLCEQCERRQVHGPEHVFLKISHPRRGLPTQRPVLQRPVAAGGPNAHHGDHLLLAQRLRARFVSHESIEERTEVPVNTAFVKMWRMRNVGELPWPAGTQLVFVGGDQLGAPNSVPVPNLPVVNGETVIAVSMSAPSEVGKYTGFWRLATDNGVRFGHRVCVDIQAVLPGSAATVPDTATAAALAANRNAVSSSAPNCAGYACDFARVMTNAAEQRPPTADPHYFLGANCVSMCLDTSEFDKKPMDAQPTPPSLTATASAEHQRATAGSTTAGAPSDDAVSKPSSATLTPLLSAAKPAAATNTTTLAPTQSAEQQPRSAWTTPLSFATAPAPAAATDAPAARPAPAALLSDSTIVRQYQYARQLNQLMEMGFTTDVDRVRSLLDGHKGDVVTVVRALLGDARHP